MLYTVKRMAELANVTVKTLHHYDKIGLLPPQEVNEAGYRLYGRAELERLQQILFYRELDFPLKDIQSLLEEEPNRLKILEQQRRLLSSRMQRLESVLETLDESIRISRKGEVMGENKMFKGFSDENEWKEALSEQQEYLKEAYDFDLLEEKEINITEMNESAIEAKAFMEGMAKALQQGWKCQDPKVMKRVESHVTFLQSHGQEMTPNRFAETARFFIQDDFHRNMLEDQQTGLSYYLCLAAESYAESSR